jgi:hypothetical protein
MHLSKEFESMFYYINIYGQYDYDISIIIFYLGRLWIRWKSFNIIHLIIFLT